MKPSKDGGGAYGTGAGGHPAWTTAMRRHVTRLGIERVGPTVCGTIEGTALDGPGGQPGTVRNMVIDACLWHRLAFVREGGQCYIQPLVLPPDMIGAMSATPAEQSQILMGVAAAWLVAPQHCMLPPLPDDVV